MKNKTAIWTVILILLLIGVYLYFTRTKEVVDAIVLTPVACTEEAKLCPDGSSVGRSGPNCLFADCPTPILVTPSIMTQPAYPADLYK